jgi:hypothetical protein
LKKVPFQKHLIGTIALMILGFNFTKRYYTFPHHHKDESKPMLLLNGELHPYEKQPAVRLLNSQLKFDYDYTYRGLKINIGCIQNINSEGENLNA